MKPLAADMPPTGVALLVLAIGAGSVFLSHVNDAGFWLVKEYFDMNVGQTGPRPRTASWRPAPR